MVKRMLFVVLSGLATTASLADQVTHDVTIDVAQAQPPFEGWGTSLCWWAHGAGDWPDERLDPLIELIVDPNVGLGYTIFRYNIGGGDDPTHDHLRRDGGIPGFLAGPEQAYEWAADANQRRVLLKLAKRVEEPIFEAFSNSPPYWMTVSGCASGNTDGSSNLRGDMYDAFADYLATVALYYRDRWGIHFRTLDPLNEPNASWWKKGNNQEGCHFEVAEQGRIIRSLRSALDRKGLRETVVSAPDTNNIDTCLTNLRAYSSDTMDALGQINTHSYHGNKRNKLRQRASTLGKRLWQSESGPLGFRGTPVEAALHMAQRIQRDLNKLQPVAWLEWQVVSGGNWGCIHIDKKSNALRKSPNFHAHAAFTRAIRPGDRIVKADPADLVAAYSSVRGELAIVIVNTTAHARLYRCTLRGFEIQRERAKVTRAFHGDVEQLVDSRDGTFSLSVDPKEIVTLRILGKRSVATKPAKAQPEKESD